MQLVEVYARAPRVSQNVKRAEVWVCCTSRRGEGSKELLLGPFIVAFGPVLPARMVHEVSRTGELAERRRAHTVDHAWFEVEEHRAWYVLSARGLVIKDVNAVELRVVVAKVFAAATDAVSSQVKLILSLKQRAKPAASRTRTCTNAAVCIASGECPSRF